jgi:adhesin HecA-like repeat protein
MVEQLEDRITPAPVSWTGGANTLNWGDTGNWLDASTGMNHVPGASDDVTINKAGVGTINIDANAYAVRSLNDTTAGLSISSGGSLSLAAVFATSTLGQNVTVQSKATLAVGAGASVTIQQGVTLTDNGTVSFASGDNVTLANNFNSTQQIVVGNGGLLNATGTSFGGGGISNVIVNTGGHLTAGNCTFGSGLTEVFLDNGSVLGGTDLTGDTFNCPLWLPESEVQDLSSSGAGQNVLFHDIDILPGSVPSGQTLALNAIGSAATANLLYVFPGNFTVLSGASMTVAATLSVLLRPGVTLTDNGTVSFASGDNVTLANNFNSTQQIVVGNGGLLNATGTSFGGGGISLLTINGDPLSPGQLTATGCTFALSSLNLNNNSNDTLSGNVLSGQLAINSGAAINISQNDFSNIGAKGVIASGDSKVHINLTYNDWGTTVPSQIAAKIEDGVTDPTSNRPTVDYTPFLSRITFNNSQGGDWGNPANWDLNRVPGAGDIVTIPPNVTVTYSSGSTTIYGLKVSGLNTVLDVTGGTLQVTGSIQVSGTGANRPTVMVDGGTLAGQTAFDVNDANLTLNSGTLSTPGGLSVRGGSTFNLNGGTFTDTATVVNSTLNSAAAFTAAPTLVFQGNSTFSGNIATGQTVWVQGSAAGNALLTIPTSLTNAGTLRLESTSDSTSSSVTVSSGTLTNATGGMIAVNAGTGGGRTLTAELANAGTLAINNTSLALGRSGANHVNTGTIQLSGAGLSVNGNNSFVNQTAGVITGSGTIDASNDPLTNNGLIDVPTAGTLTITGTLTNFDPVLQRLSGGSFHVAGTLGLDNSGSNIRSLYADLELTNPGSKVVSNQGGADLLAGLNTIAAQGTLALRNRSFTLAGALSDAGTLSVSNSATLTVNGAYSQSGTLNIFGRGNVVLNGAFTNFNSTNNTLTGGTYVIAGTTAQPSALLFGNSTFSAKVATLAANLTLDGPGAQILDNTTLNDALGPNLATIATGGHLTILDGYNFTTATMTGNFQNNGILTVGANSPGGLGSIFTVTGNFTQGSSATLEIQLGDVPSNGNFGQLKVNGTATFAGTLTATLVNGYTQMTNDTFPIVTYAPNSRSGVFTTVPPGFNPVYDDVDGILNLVAQ